MLLLVPIADRSTHKLRHQYAKKVFSTELSKVLQPSTIDLDTLKVEILWLHSSSVDCSSWLNKQNPDSAPVWTLCAGKPTNRWRLGYSKNCLTEIWNECTCPYCLLFVLTVFYLMRNNESQQCKLCKDVKSAKMLFLPNLIWWRPPFWVTEKEIPHLISGTICIKRV